MFAYTRASTRANNLDHADAKVASRETRLLFLEEIRAQMPNLRGLSILSPGEPHWALQGNIQVEKKPSMR